MIPIDEFRTIASTQRVIPILRTATVADAIATARVCFRAGMTAIELTTSTQNVREAVSVLASEGVTVGVGTIRSAEEIAVFAAEGASFVVSYFTPEGFVRASIDAGVIPVPGVLTPGEMQRATSEGAGILKIFPSWQSSPKIIGDMAPLLGAVDYIATAGLTPETTRGWLEAGALAVGTGRALGTVAINGEKHVEAYAREILAFAGGVGTTS
jgi:2-dehydro-3-deoxyphosphogluconate aldolase/(4S)-4-hydroxy-2-oxoglutarate aldolase